MWAARAYVAEEWEREDAAVAHWLEAARLFTAGTFTSPLASIAPELAGQVAEAAATAPLAPARPEEERRRATGAAHDALAWGFGPVRPATHARALQALDAGDLRAIPVVLWIAGMAARDPATLAPARQALEAFFARAAEEGADPRAVLRVTALLRDDGAAPREIRDVAAAAFTRTLLAPLERLTQSFADLADVQAR
ncbi:MAG: RidA family protein, partial [Solirubrobacterales bacterium]|nr:RidA family protein [Solirubrobacterales bacterium]